MHVCWERAGPPNGSHVTGSWIGNACELGCWNIGAPFLWVTAKDHKEPVPSFLRQCQGVPPPPLGNRAPDTPFSFETRMDKLYLRYHSLSCSIVTSWMLRSNCSSSWQSWSWLCNYVALTIDPTWKHITQRFSLFRLYLCIHPSNEKSLIKKSKVFIIKDPKNSPACSLSSGHFRYLSLRNSYTLTERDVAKVLTTALPVVMARH